MVQPRKKAILLRGSLRVWLQAAMASAVLAVFATLGDFVWIWPNDPIRELWAHQPPAFPGEEKGKTFPSSKNICFLTAAYADSRSLVDKIEPNPFANESDVKFFAFTNLLDLEVEGWESIHIVPNYTRRITQSRYGKFLAWKVPKIQQHCQVVFYIDGSIRLAASIDTFRSLASQVRNISNNEEGPGWMQLHHRRPYALLMDDLKGILNFMKDAPSRIFKTLQWLRNQSDFDPTNTHLYINTHLVYSVPPSPVYERHSMEFWDEYSKEEMTWRDQPIWNYLIQKHGRTPLGFPTTRENDYFNSIQDAKGWGGHRYTNGPTNEAYKLAFFGYKPLLGSFYLRGHQFADQFIKFVADENEDSVPLTTDSLTVNNSRLLFLPSTHHCRDVDRYCADICIFVGPCPSLGTKDHCCRLKILDIVDKYLYKREQIDSMLHNYDGIVVNSEYMKEYFVTERNYTGEIEVVWQYSDPRWYQVTTNKRSDPSRLRFGFMGSIPSLNHTANFLHYKTLLEQQDRYSIDMIDTETYGLPSAVDFECDLSIREVGSDLALFKPITKLATAAALHGHNIITAWDAAVKDVLPADYPFVLSNTSLESVQSMLDLAMADYAGNQTLWKKGLAMMEEVKEKLRLERIAKQYLDFLERLAMVGAKKLHARDFPGPKKKKTPTKPVKPQNKPKKLSLEEAYIARRKKLRQKRSHALNEPSQGSNQDLQVDKKEAGQKKRISLEQAHFLRRKQLGYKTSNETRTHGRFGTSL